MSADAPLSPAELRELGRVGFGQADERAGTFLVADHAVLEALPRSSQLEILPLAEALARYDWLPALRFGLVERERDEYTRAAAGQMVPLGHFIRVFAGQRVLLPVQTCFLIRTTAMRQVVHNIVVAEPGAEVHFISGCTTASHVETGQHIGISEFYVRPGATVTSTMIHSWGPGVEVYPRSAAQVEQGGRFISNYVAMTPVRYIQMYPEATIAADGLGEFYSVVYAPAGSRLDLGGRARLQGAGASAEIVSRVVSDGGQVITRGHLIGEVDGMRGAMACNGLLLDAAGSIHAIPELEGRALRVALSHEASVGMISQEELDYLMASGIDEEAARSLIVQGFLDVRIRHLPEVLQRAINAMIERAGAGAVV
ncbi:MAG: SufD family Fe-S cluster assembly protein [Pseudomonadota bacterium]|uniref:SufD family Fe-S cluster assembly protein n=1 Tax=Thermithiobacillus tepidarius TaxID=929 RepID=UPI000407B44E|nr:SufD family Fe-S cluster assembly protein [Thermithiobacillus tepidarius]